MSFCPFKWVYVQLYWDLIERWNEDACTCTKCELWRKDELTPELRRELEAGLAFRDSLTEDEKDDMMNDTQLAMDSDMLNEYIEKQLNGIESTRFEDFGKEQLDNAILTTSPTVIPARLQ